MKNTQNPLWKIFSAAALALAIAPVVSRAVPMNANPGGTNQGYIEVNLVSDVAGNAPATDARLVNPWGLVVGPGVEWVSDNGTGLTTVYGATGFPFNFAINIPAPNGVGRGRPSGLVFNDIGQFVITNVAGANGVHYGPSTFLAATEDGTIVAWNYFVTGPNAIIAVDNSESGAVYTGLAIALLTNGAPMLYAANFHAGKVDMFNGNFQYAGSFTDANLPAGFAPFNVKTIDGKLFVTFALRDGNARGAVAGPGNGYIDVFNPNGTLLVSRYASEGPLNAPWGMVVSPWGFGPFSHALLVGNFGDGRINAYDLTTGVLLGHLTQPDGSDLVIDGLWGLGFASELSNAGGFGFDAGRLYFTASPNGGADGLFGYIGFNGPFWPPALFRR